MKDKLKAFFSDNFNILVIAVLVFAFAIRLFFFFKYNTQPLWWDEADYLGVAKHYAFGLTDTAAAWRSRGMSMIYSLFFMTGLGEVGVKFFQVMISMAGIVMTYIFGKKFFNKRVALIATVFMSVLWLHLFWTARVSLGIFSMLIWLISAYFFWKGMEERGKWWHMALSFGLVGWGIFAYESVGFIIPFYAVYLFVVHRFKFLKNKNFWAGIAGAVVAAVPFLIYNIISFGHFYPRFQRIFANLGAGSSSNGFNWGEFVSFFMGMPDILKWPILLLFIIGLIYFINMFLGLDYVWKGKKSLRKPFFFFLWMLIVFALFSFYIAIEPSFLYEPRFLMPMYPIMMFVAAMGLMYIYDFLKKYQKQFAVAVVLVLVVVGGYVQLADASERIEMKSQTYLMEPVAGEWLKENTEPGDYILTCSQTVPINYYTEREVQGFGDAERLTERVEEYDPAYIVLDFYGPCETSYFDSLNFTLVPVKEFIDPVYNQPLMYILEVQY